MGHSQSWAGYKGLHSVKALHGCFVPLLTLEAPGMMLCLSTVQHSFKEQALRASPLQISMATALLGDVHMNGGY